MLSTLTNPLREGLAEERQVESCIMVIFGAHGDLTKRKLIPALYALFNQNLLPHNFTILGTSRTKMTNDAFRQSMKESIVKFAPDIPFSEEAFERFSQGLFYESSDADQLESYQNLAKALENLAKQRGTKGNCIYYLSTPPSLYSPIIEGLSKSKLAFKCPKASGAWPRIIIEKPFGHDLNSALTLDSQLHENFTEDQIYRIDHYLGKETVQNIMTLRFANGIFEPLWNKEHIDHIQITNAETLGIEGRGPYYEEAGNLKDMIQNHLLQVVALIAMDPPISLDSESIRDEKTKVFKAIRPFDLTRLSSQIVRGQYGPGYILGSSVCGYREEDRVSAQSKTETFTALRLFIDNWRWAEVPIYLRSGKRLAKSMTEVAIHFKKAPHRLFRKDGHMMYDALNPNVLVINIQPDEGISLRFATKQPGPTNSLRWLSMDFKYGTAFGARTPSAYERLILDSLLGDPSLFARSDAVQTCWELIDPVINAWKREEPPSFPNYQAGTAGPPEADQLIALTGHVWRRI